MASEGLGGRPVTADPAGEGPCLLSADRADDKAQPETYHPVVEIDRLPALIDRARSKLAEARTSAEVLEAKHVAEAALHYAKVTAAANEAHADCLRIITRAEIRLAREIDAGQERGEIARVGDNPNVRTSDNQTTIGELGLDRRRVAEWRGLAAAGEQAVDAAINEVVVRTREPPSER